MRPIASVLARASIENGLLSVGRAGELRVQLWNVRSDREAAARLRRASAAIMNSTS